MSTDIVPFTGGHFPEVVSAKTIEAAISPEVALLRPPLSLLGDIRVSQYGAIGFTLLDSKPENKICNWNTGSDYYGYESNDEPEDYQYPNPTPADLLKITRSFGTRHGFKLIRYAIIPEELTDVLKTNSWVGPAILKQALEEGVTPTEYLEEDVGPKFAILTTGVGRPDDGGGGDRQKLDEFDQPFKAKVAFYETLLRSLDGSIPEDSFKHLGPAVWDVTSHLPANHRAYVSFHPWHLHGSVTAEAPHIVERMVNNIDALIANFIDKDGIMRSSLKDRLEHNPTFLPIGRVALGTGLSEIDS